MMTMTMTIMRRRKMMRKIMRIIVLENIKEKDQYLIALMKMRYMEVKVTWKIPTMKAVVKEVLLNMVNHQRRIKKFQRKEKRKMVKVLLRGLKKVEMMMIIIHLLIFWIEEQYRK